MMHRAVSQGCLFGVALGALLFLAGAPLGALAQRERPSPRHIAFRTVFAGVSADRQGSAWEGSADGEFRGRVRIELEQAESPLQAANPVWHVRTRLAVAEGSGARWFEAELEGMVDWRSGVTRLAGAITDGWMKGAWVQADGRSVDGDIAGTLVISPLVARK